MIRRLYRSLTTTAATLALTTALAGSVTAQGVPTVDTQNIAQEIRQLQQMLQDFGIQTDLLDNALAQLDLLQQQFDQLEEMYASLTGPRSILGLAMGGDLDGLLQANFEDIPGLIRGIQAGDWSSLIGPNAGFVKAGSLASSYSDQDDWLAILDDLLDRPPSIWPRSLYPKRFKVASNPQVARSLGIEQIDPATVSLQLAEGESTP